MRDLDRDDPYGTPGAEYGGATTGWALRSAILWGGIGLALYFAVSYRVALLPHDAATPAKGASGDIALTANPAAAAAANALVYRADKFGHVWLEAAVDGVPVRFLVDTGATLVTLTTRDAAAAGISAGDLVFDQPMSTANGVVRVARVTLREVRLGQLSLYDVAATVNPNLGTSLLGMSFLSRLDSYEMRDGVLTINW